MQGVALEIDGHETHIARPFAFAQHGPFGGLRIGMIDLEDDDATQVTGQAGRGRVVAGAE